ncbi:aspartate/glutamate racemase family protein [Piscinibacter sp.]|uniref:aspartate/glutamate racemase family protein n=1 Tax=Piscinibacter sp. TaxID=1903157 RepID=UPI0039E3502C
MPRILLINPNTSRATTDMMVALAQAELPAGFEVHGVTASRGVAMITTAAELEASAEQTLECWAAAGQDWAGVILSCFGDPGIARLRAAAAPVPVVGLCEAAMHDAARGGRRFGVATTTPELAEAITALAGTMGLAAQFTGVCATGGDPHDLTARTDALAPALADAITHCVQHDGAQAVIVGGGPLGNAAAQLSARFSLPVIAPIASAARLLLRRIDPDRRLH